MAKQYKNVYTILEKARKGELVTQSTGSLFKPMNRYKKPDIISPHLHYLDEKSLFRNIYRFLTSTDRIANFQSQLGLKGIHKQPVEIMKALGDIINKFPKSLIYDFFKLYNKDISELTFEDRNKDTQMRYQFIEKANQPLHKILTNGSNLKSLIYTEHVMEYFIKVMLFKHFANEPIDDLMNQMQQEETRCSVQVATGSGSGQDQEKSDSDGEQEEQETQQPQSQQGDGNDQDQQQDQKNQEQEGDGDEENDDEQCPEPDSSSHDSEGTSGGSSGASKQGTSEHNGGTIPDIQKIMNDLMKNDHELEEALNKAMTACEELDQVYSETEQNDMWEDMQDLKGAGYDPESIKRAANKVRDMQMNMNGIKSFIKHIMDKSKNYFSAAETTTYEPLMETGNMDSVEDYYMLHPKLRKFMFEDILTKDIVKQGKINIYIDTSGSMDAGCGARKQNGNYITRLDFAKAFALKMKEMDLLNSVYIFDTYVRKRKNHMMDIINISSGGGTSIEAVVNHIIQTDENAIVITDADDHCFTYTPKAYFIGTEGARFNGFRNLDQYHKQMCVFDGHKVHKVNQQGFAV